MEAFPLPKTAFCRKVQFVASHHYALPDASPEENRRLFGDSATPHAHHWSLTLWLEGDVDPRTGMITDLVAVDRILQEQVVMPLEGRSFRDYDPDFFKKHQPTNEVLANYFAYRLAPLFTDAKLVKLQVAECDGIFAEWSL